MTPEQLVSLAIAGWPPTLIRALRSTPLERADRCAAALLRVRAGVRLDAATIAQLVADAEATRDQTWDIKHRLLELPATPATPATTPTGGTT